MFNSQNNPFPDSALPDLLSGGDVQPPAEWVIPRTVSPVRFNTLVLLAVAVAREHGIGSPKWVEFGALTAMEIGPRVWDVKRQAIHVINGDAFTLFETGHA